MAPGNTKMFLRPTVDFGAQAGAQQKIMKTFICR